MNGNGLCLREFRANYRRPVLVFRFEFIHLFPIPRDDLAPPLGSSLVSLVYGRNLVKLSINSGDHSSHPVIQSVII